MSNPASVLVVMPTIPCRVEMAAATIEGLARQRPSQIVVLLNGHSSPEGLPDCDAVQYRLNPAGTGPVSRFEVDAAAWDYVFYVDDDIAYPPDYIHRTVSVLRLLGADCVVSYHSRWWPTEVRSYRERRVLGFKRSNDCAFSCPYVGTGVSALPGSAAVLLKGPQPPIFSRNDDVWLSAVLSTSGYRLLRPVTPDQWLRPQQQVKRVPSIFGSARADGFQERERAIAYACARFGWRLTDRSFFRV